MSEVDYQGMSMGEFAGYTPAQVEAAVTALSRSGALDHAKRNLVHSLKLDADIEYIKGYVAPDRADPEVLDALDAVRRRHRDADVLVAEAAKSLRARVNGSTTLADGRARVDLALQAGEPSSYSAGHGERISLPGGSPILHEVNQAIAEVLAALPYDVEE